MSEKKFPYAQVVVIGSTGQTGRRVVELLGQEPDLKVISTSRSGQWKVDLESDSDTLAGQLNQLGSQLTRGKPTALIFAAAFTNVEVCETDSKKCERINETNTAAVLDWAHREFDAKLVFYSTDYVFDGSDGPYPEDAPRKALSGYGKAKVFIEEWIEKHSPRALILRTTGVYDYLPGSKNFLMQMLDLWGQGKTTRIPSDQFANPVWAYELAKATIDLLKHEASGIYHVAGGSYLPRHEFAKTIARVFDLNTSLIEPVLTSDLGQKAARPLRGGLKCEKLKRKLGWVPKPAEEVLKHLKSISASRPS